MTGVATVLLVGGDDPAAAPLAKLLRGRGLDLTVTKAVADAMGNTPIWVADQVTFLMNAAQIRPGAETCDVLLRPGLDAGRALATIPLAIKQALKMYGDRARFWAISEAGAQALVHEYGIPVEPLVPDDTSAQSIADLDISIARGTVRPINAPDSALSLQNVNLARLASRFKLTSTETGEGGDLATLANAAALAKVARAPRVLFIVPSGAGLGHMSRSLAIAGQLSDYTCDFIVYNDAAYLAADASYRTYHRQSATQIGADSDSWRVWETTALSEYISTERPAAVIVDASHIDPYIVNALSDPEAEDTALIWVRREMWRADRQARSAVNGLHADLVIVPGEIAEGVQASQARQDFSQCHEVSPVIFDGPQPPMTRRQARRALGIGRGRVCLVSLGAWQPDRVRDEIIAAARARRVRLAWARSPLAGVAQGADVIGGQISLYPLSRYLEAFDGVISAAGYNSFHELMLRFARPVLFLPVDQSGLDDQVARARFAAQKGMADMNTGDDVSTDLASFFGRFSWTSSQTRPPQSENGAEAAARLIDHHIATRAGSADD